MTWSGTSTGAESCRSRLIPRGASTPRTRPRLVSWRSRSRERASCCTRRVCIGEGLRPPRALCELRCSHLRHAQQPTDLEAAGFFIISAADPKDGSHSGCGGPRRPPNGVHRRSARAAVPRPNAHGAPPPGSSCIYPPCLRANGQKPPGERCLYARADSALGLCFASLRRALRAGCCSPAASSTLSSPTTATAPRCGLAGRPMQAANARQPPTSSGAFLNCAISRAPASPVRPSLSAA